MEAKTYKLGYHLVAFLDVLGQRDKLRGLALPKTAAEEEHVKKVLSQTAGFIVDLRRVFKRQFEVFDKTVTKGPHMKGTLCPNFLGFSDSFVTSVPLRNDAGDLGPVVTVFSTLFAAAAVMLTSLASKHPLRGGIDVGLATEIGAGEIYGTALERAYLLECEIAQYPRIVIGDGLWSYLNAVLVEFGSGKAPVARAITAITEKFMEFIATDQDGKRILDYLGTLIFEHSGPAHKEKMVQPAYEFVLAEQKRVIAEGNPHLIERYASFRRYVESRLPLWNIVASKE